MANWTDKMKEALQAGRSGQYAKKSPYERFGFKKDPFQLKIINDDTVPLVIREDVLVDFAVRIGNAIRLFEENSSSPFRHLLTHGLRGSGKTTVALHFVNEWTEIGFQDYETKYTSVSSWRNPDELPEIYSTSTQTLQSYSRFLSEVQAVSKPLILFIDDLDFTVNGTAAIPRINDFLNDIESRAPFGVILIGFINSLTLSIVSEPHTVADTRSFFDNFKPVYFRTFLPNFNPEHFFIPVFSKSEIENLLKQRLHSAHRSDDLFSIKAFDTIADYSMGLPIIALKIASACLDELIIREADRITRRVVKGVVNQFGYQQAISLIESMINEDKEETSSILTPKRRDIISSILEHQIREYFFFPPTKMEGLRSSFLADFFGVNLSTMNYHIKPLTSTEPFPILETKDDDTDARSKIFKVNLESPMASAVEILTVRHKLQHDRYNVTPQSISIHRREAE